MKKSALYVLVALLLFCVFYGVRYMNKPEERIQATMQVYENKIDVKGVIVKSEQVYTANTSGVKYNYVSEGTRIKKNSKIATVYTGENAEKKLMELNGISKKIEELENSGVTAYTVGSSSEDNLEKIKEGIITSRIHNDLSGMREYKEQITSIATGNVTNIQKENMDELAAKKQSLEAEMNNYKNDIYAQNTGVFSKEADGFEGELTPDLAGNINLSQFKEIMAKKPVQTDGQTDYVTNGMPVCKVINNHAWYALFEIEEKTAENLKIGQKVKMRFAELPGVEAEGSVYALSSESSINSNKVVTIKSEEYKDGILDLRFTDAELVTESYEGCIVPISAIHIENGKKGIMVSRGASKAFRECDLVYTDNSKKTVIIAPTKGGGKTFNENDYIIIGEK